MNIQFPVGIKSSRVVLYNLEGRHIAELTGKAVLVNGAFVMPVKIPSIPVGAYLLFIDTDQLERRFKIRILSL